jgi:hypothetical protein
VAEMQEEFLLENTEERGMFCHRMMHLGRNVMYNEKSNGEYKNCVQFH